MKKASVTGVGGMGQLVHRALLLVALALALSLSVASLTSAQAPRFSLTQTEDSLSLVEPEIWPRFLHLPPELQEMILAPLPAPVLRALAERSAYISGVLLPRMGVQLRYHLAHDVQSMLACMTHAEHADCFAYWMERGRFTDRQHLTLAMHGVDVLFYAEQPVRRAPAEWLSSPMAAHQLLQLMERLGPEHRALVRGKFRMCMHVHADRSELLHVLHALEALSPSAMLPSPPRVAAGLHLSPGYAAMMHIMIHAIGRRVIEHQPGPMSPATLDARLAECPVDVNSEDFLHDVFLRAVRMRNLALVRHLVTEVGVFAQRRMNGREGLLDWLLENVRLGNLVPGTSSTYRFPPPPLSEAEEMFWEGVTQLLVEDGAPVTTDAVGTLVLLSAASALRYLCQRDPPVRREALLHGLKVSLSQRTGNMTRVLVGAHDYTLPELRSLQHQQQPAILLRKQELQAIIRQREQEVASSQAGREGEEEKTLPSGMMQRPRSWLRSWSMQLRDAWLRNSAQSTVIPLP